MECFEIYGRQGCVCENYGPSTKPVWWPTFTHQTFWYQICRFEIIANLIFRQFGLKMPIHAPRMGIGIWPLNGEQCQRYPKKAHPCVISRCFSHRARKSVDGSTCMQVPEKSKNLYKFKQSLYFTNNNNNNNPICKAPECQKTSHGSLPHWWICTTFSTGVGLYVVADLIHKKWQIIWRSVKACRFCRGLNLTCPISTPNRL